MTIKEAEIKATEVAKEYIEKGFHFNSYTMSGIGNGEKLRIDLTKNDSFIRIYIGSQNREYKVHVLGKCIKGAELLSTIWTCDMFKIDSYM